MCIMYKKIYVNSIVYIFTHWWLNCKIYIDFCIFKVYYSNRYTILHTIKEVL